MQPETPQARARQNRQLLTLTPNNTAVRVTLQARPQSDPSSGGSGCYRTAPVRVLTESQKREDPLQHRGGLKPPPQRHVERRELDPHAA